MSEKPKKAGRPKLEIDGDLVEKLAGIGCPNKEIAAITGCSVDTLDRHFAEVIAKGRENGKTRLRKKQIEVALAGNVTMLIFLGKNMLGQADKQEISGPDGSSILQSTLTGEQESGLKDLIAAVRAKIKSR
jgi:hypothetical protein